MSVWFVTHRSIAIHKCIAGEGVLRIPGVAETLQSAFFDAVDFVVDAPSYSYTCSRKRKSGIISSCERLAKSGGICGHGYCSLTADQP
jgi:hypothetical protein